MRSPPAAPVATVLALAIALTGLLAGCVAPGAAPPAPTPSAPVPTTAAPAAAPDDPAPSAPPAPTNPAPLPTLSLRLDAPPRPALSFGPVPLVATASLDQPLQENATLVLRLRAPGLDRTISVNVTTAQQSATGTIHYDAPPGTHSVEATAQWNGSKSIVANATIGVTVAAPVNLVLNASEQYASGQNVFFTELVVPFAPWQNESAYDVLVRAAENWSFDHRADYDPQLESYYVSMINGTAEDWAVQGVISRSWMILHNDAVNSVAVDDLYPQANDTVEFRFVQCWSTGNCEGV